VNALLAGVVFMPAANVSSSFTIAINVDDGVVSVGGTEAMTGIAVNHAPVLDTEQGADAGDAGGGSEPAQWCGERGSRRRRRQQQSEIEG
jgi:hypothetical protein